MLDNAEGGSTTPSAVCFAEAVPIVGREAVRSLRHHPEDVVRFAKRDMADDGRRFVCGGKSLSAEAVQSYVLTKVRADARRRLGGDVESAVITVPAFFNEIKRRATIAAAEMAGLKVAGLISEPTAAALAWSYRRGGEDALAETTDRHVLVYDLGGGTFDVSLVRLRPNRVDVVAVDGNARLGGVDWDSRIVDWMTENAANGSDPTVVDSIRPTLMLEAEQIKQSLTLRRSVPVRIREDGFSVDATLTRDVFERRTAALLDRTRFTTASVLKSAGMDATELDRILLVGGSSRMPQVARMLRQRFGVTVDDSLPPDTAVASGAAVYAGLELYHRDVEHLPSDDRSALTEVHDVSAHDLGILGREKSSGRKVRAVLIPRHTTLPAEVRKRYVTALDDQRSIQITVVEGGNRAAAGAQPVGAFTVTDLPSGLPRGTAVDVGVRYDRDGLLTVAARVPAADREASIRVQRPIPTVAPEHAEEIDEFWESLELDFDN